jgi:hypothetical protein
MTCWRATDRSRPLPFDPQLNDLIELNLHIYPKRSPYARSGFPSRATTAPSSPVIKNAALPSENDAAAPASGASSSRGVDIAVPGDSEGGEEVRILQAWRKREHRKRLARCVSKVASIGFIVLLASESGAAASAPSVVLLTSAVLLRAELFPSFENLLAFMGSAPAFLVSIILPLTGKKIYLLDNAAEGVEKAAARRRIHWSLDGLCDWLLIVIGVVGAGMGVWGVIVR